MRSKSRPAAKNAASVGQLRLRYRRKQASVRIWRHAVEEQEVRAYGQNPRLRWAGLVIGCVGSFAALGLSIALDAWQSPQRTLNWPSRLFCVGYGVLFGAWIGHAYGWIPGTCIIALFVFFAIDRKSAWSSADLKSPVRILQL